MTETIRTFIAIQLTADLKSILTEIGHEINNRIPPQTVRWVKPAAMHLTLVFLGDTPAAQLNAVEQAMRSATTSIPPITLTATGIGCFPNTRRPRVVWVGIEETTGHLQHLKKRVDQALEPLGFQPERRRYSPHLTLGRVHKRASRGDAQQLGKVIESATLKDAGEMTAQQIHLIRSDLRPTGPIYTVLASAPLAGETR
jgi:2'-5' RNA ligase